MVGRRGVIQTLTSARKKKDKIRKYKKKTTRARIQTRLEERKREKLSKRSAQRN